MKNKKIITIVMIALIAIIGVFAYLSFINKEGTKKLSINEDLNNIIIHPGI